MHSLLLASLNSCSLEKKSSRSSLMGEVLSRDPDVGKAQGAAAQLGAKAEKTLSAGTASPALPPLCLINLRGTLHSLTLLVSFQGLSTLTHVRLSRQKVFAEPSLWASVGERAVNQTKPLCL